MHIPDGFLATPVWLSLDAAAVPAVGWLARRAQREVGESQVPLLGVMGAFVFAAQMINFPVGPGTSGHLVGSALLAAALGPAAASIVMTAVLAVQALVFQDGGILALGANVLNMAIAGVGIGYLPYYWWGARARRAALFAGAALSVFTGALLAIAELRLSGIAIPGAVLWITIGVFAVTALVEGAITVAVFESVRRLTPVGHAPACPRPHGFVALALAAMGIATLGVLFASTRPDVLERMAGRLEITGRARTLIATPLADYHAAFLAGDWLPKAAAGLAGVALVTAALFLLARLIARQRSA